MEVCLSSDNERLVFDLILHTLQLQTLTASQDAIMLGPR